MLDLIIIDPIMAYKTITLVITQKCSLNQSAPLWAATAFTKNIEERAENVTQISKWVTLTYADAL